MIQSLVNETTIKPFEGISQGTLCSPVSRSGLFLGITIVVLGIVSIVSGIILTLSFGLPILGMSLILGGGLLLALGTYFLFMRIKAQELTHAVLQTEKEGQESALILVAMRERLRLLSVKSDALTKEEIDRGEEISILQKSLRSEEETSKKIQVCIQELKFLQANQDELQKKRDLQLQILEKARQEQKVFLLEREIQIAELQTRLAQLEEVLEASEQKSILIHSQILEIEIRLEELYEQSRQFRKISFFKSDLSELSIQTCNVNEALTSLGKEDEELRSLIAEEEEVLKNKRIELEEHTNHQRDLVSRLFLLKNSFKEMLEQQSLLERTLQLLSEYQLECGKILEARGLTIQIEDSDQQPAVLFENMRLLLEKIKETKQKQYSLDRLKQACEPLLNELSQLQEQLLQCDDRVKVAKNDCNFHREGFDNERMVALRSNQARRDWQCLKQRYFYSADETSEMLETQIRLLEDELTVVRVKDAQESEESKKLCIEEIGFQPYREILEQIVFLKSHILRLEDEFPISSEVSLMQEKIGGLILLLPGPDLVLRFQYLCDRRRILEEAHASNLAREEAIVSERGSVSGRLMIKLFESGDSKKIDRYLLQKRKLTISRAGLQKDELKLVIGLRELIEQTQIRIDQLGYSAKLVESPGLEQNRRQVRRVVGHLVALEKDLTRFKAREDHLVNQIQLLENSGDSVERLELLKEDLCYVDRLIAGQKSKIQLCEAKLEMMKVSSSEIHKNKVVCFLMEIILAAHEFSSFLNRSIDDNADIRDRLDVVQNQRAEIGEKISELEETFKRGSTEEQLRIFLVELAELNKKILGASQDLKEGLSEDEIQARVLKWEERKIEVEDRIAIIESAPLDLQSLKDGLEDLLSEREGLFVRGGNMLASYQRKVLKFQKRLKELCSLLTDSEGLLSEQNKRVSRIQENDLVETAKGEGSLLENIKNSLVDKRKELKECLALKNKQRESLLAELAVSKNIFFDLRNKQKLQEETVEGLEAAIERHKSVLEVASAESLSEAMEHLKSLNLELEVQNDLLSQAKSKCVAQSVQMDILQERLDFLLEGTSVEELQILERQVVELERALEGQKTILLDLLKDDVFACLIQERVLQRHLKELKLDMQLILGDTTLLHKSSVAYNSSWHLEREEGNLLGECKYLSKEELILIMKEDPGVNLMGQAEELWKLAVVSLDEVKQARITIKQTIALLKSKMEGVSRALSLHYPGFPNMTSDQVNRVLVVDTVRLAHEVHDLNTKLLNQYGNLIYLKNSIEKKLQDYLPGEAIQDEIKKREKELEICLNMISLSLPYCEELENRIDTLRRKSEKLDNQKTELQKLLSEISITKSEVEVKLNQVLGSVHIGTSEVVLNTIQKLEEEKNAGIIGQEQMAKSLLDGEKNKISMHEELKQLQDESTITSGPYFMRCGEAELQLRDLEKALDEIIQAINVQKAQLCELRLDDER